MRATCSCHNSMYRCAKASRSTLPSSESVIMELYRPALLRARGGVGSVHPIGLLMTPRGTTRLTLTPFVVQSTI